MPRSTAVSVFGILNTAIGALGIMGSFRTIAIFSSRAAANNPVTKDDVREPQFRDIDESAPSYRADHICSFADHLELVSCGSNHGRGKFQSVTRSMRFFLCLST